MDGRKRVDRFQISYKDGRVKGKMTYVCVCVCVGKETQMV